MKRACYFGCAFVLAISAGPGSAQDIMSSWNQLDYVGSPDPIAPDSFDLRICSDADLPESVIVTTSPRTTAPIGWIFFSSTEGQVFRSWLFMPQQDGEREMRVEEAWCEYDETPVGLFARTNRVGLLILFAADSAFSDGESRAFVQIRDEAGISRPAEFVVQSGGLRIQ